MGFVTCRRPLCYYYSVYCIVAAGRIGVYAAKNKAILRNNWASGACILGDDICFQHVIICFEYILFEMRLSCVAEPSVDGDISV